MKHIDIVVHQRIVPTPIGPLRLLASARALVGVYFPDHAAASAPEAPTRREHPILEQAATELREYFAGRRTHFDTPIEAAGTAFQQAVWAGLRTIEIGAVISYAELGRRIGRRGAARAIGAANARNPLSVFVPCHRVVGSDGSLTGYAGNLTRKQWLLEHERALAAGRERAG